MAPIFGELLPRIANENKNWKFNVSKETKVSLLDEIKNNSNETKDDSSLIYTKMYLNLRNCFNKTRTDSKINYRDYNNNKDNDYSDEEDVVDPKINSKRKKTEKLWKKEKYLKQVMTLISELRESEAKEKITEEQQNVLEFLDLLECLKRIEEYEEICCKFSSISLCEVEESFDSNIIDIKVKFGPEIKSFSMKRNQKFSSIMQLIAKWYNQDLCDLVFRINDMPIDSDSTPLSIGLKVCDIINCYKSNKYVNQAVDDPNILTLKLRDKNGTQVELKVSKFDRVCKIMSKYSKLKGLSFMQFSLEFDGKRLDRESKIVSKGIEDLSQIDVIIKTI